MKRYKLYTDGSHFKSPSGSGRLGIGAVLVNELDTIVGTMSKEITTDDLVNDIGSLDVSNPTMEMYAVLVALTEFLDKVAENEVDIYADYEGVTKWMTDKWVARKPYIIKIKKDINTIIDHYNIKVTFNWIKGHSGNKYNEVVDKLAKGIK